MTFGRTPWTRDRPIQRFLYTDSYLLTHWCTPVVRVESVTVVTVNHCKSFGLWCRKSVAEIYQCFGGVCYLCLQNSSFFLPEKWASRFVRNIGKFRIISSTNFNAQFNNNMYVTHVNIPSTDQSALNRCSVQPLRRSRIPDAVFVQLFLLRMGMSRPETCRG